MLMMINIFFIFCLVMQIDTLKKTMELNIQFLLLQKKNKEALKSYKKLQEETKGQIEVINDDKPIKYRKHFKKIKSELDNDLPLGKTFNIPDMIIVAASVPKKNGKYYPQFYFT